MFANAKKHTGVIKHCGIRIEDCFNFKDPVSEDAADRAYVVEYEGGDIPDGVFPLVTSAAWERYIVAMPVRMPASLIGVRGRVTFADLVDEGAFGGFDSSIVDVKYHPAANGGVAVMVRWEKHRNTTTDREFNPNPPQSTASATAIGSNAKMEYILDDEGLLNVNAIFSDRPGGPKAPKTKSLQAAWSKWRMQGGGMNYQTFVDTVYPMVDEDDEDLTGDVGN